MRSPKTSKKRASAHSGQPQDVGLLYEQYSSRVAAYAMRRANRADAADIVAETFLVAWRRREQIPPEPMSLPWLYGVARRVLANHSRANYRRGRLHDRLATQFTHHHLPTSHLEVAEGCEQVGLALRKLSNDDAEVLRLTAWEELTPSQIAAAMDLEPEAVRQRLHRARKRLRKQLDASSVERRPATSAVRGFSGATQPSIAGAHLGGYGLGTGGHHG